MQIVLNKIISGKYCGDSIDLFSDTNLVVIKPSNILIFSKSVEDISLVEKNDKYSIIEIVWSDGDKSKAQLSLEMYEKIKKSLTEPSDCFF